MNDQEESCCSRRHAMLAGAVLVTATACGSEDSSAPAESEAATAAPTPGDTSASAGAALAKTADIPVGEGKIFATQKVVVTQPTKGQFKAFSSTCTHKGCQVDKVASGIISCPCHGSEYAVADGAVKKGPAPAPLPSLNIKVTNGEIFLI